MIVEVTKQSKISDGHWHMEVDKIMPNLNQDFKKTTFHTSVPCFKLEKQQKVLEKDSEMYMSLKNQMGPATFGRSKGALYPRGIQTELSKSLHTEPSKVFRNAYFFLRYEITEPQKYYFNSTESLILCIC